MKIHTTTIVVTDPLYGLTYKFNGPDINEIDLETAQKRVSELIVTVEIDNNLEDCCPNYEDEWEDELIN